MTHEELTGVTFNDLDPSGTCHVTFGIPVSRLLMSACYFIPCVRCDSRRRLWSWRLQMPRWANLYPSVKLVQWAQRLSWWQWWSRLSYV